MNSMPPRLFGKCLSTATRSAQQKTPCWFHSSDLRPNPARTKLNARAFNTSGFRQDVEHQEHPRWQQTPAKMKAPFRSKPPVFGNEFVVNEDPERLNRVYVRMLGRDGDRMLSEEVKWLAVTHKSFDHGRRGFNDRLSFLGKRIVHLQTSLALIHAYSATPTPPPPDQHERVPYEHPALEGLRGLTDESKDVIDRHKRLAQLAESYGLNHVIRWKPRNANDLGHSGYQLVYAQTIFAIVGALALEKGGEVANKITRERILKPLGLGL